MSEELRKLRNEIEDILERVNFSDLSDGTNLINKCVKIGKIEMLKEVEHKIIILELTIKSWGERWVKLREEIEELKKL